MKPRYLGDAVYVSWDGYCINLAVNHHTNHAVSLEPQVMEALKKYEKDILEEIKIENPKSNGSQNIS